MSLESIDAERAKKRLLIMVYYTGPWDRLASWLWKTDKVVFDEDDNPISGGVEDDSFRDRLAAYCSDRDTLWREKYVRSGSMPHKRWIKK